jgi:hypothetical protein
MDRAPRSSTGALTTTIPTTSYQDYCDTLFRVARCLGSINLIYPLIHDVFFFRTPTLDAEDRRRTRLLLWRLLCYITTAAKSFRRAGRTELFGSTE